MWTVVHERGWIFGQITLDLKIQFKPSSHATDEALTLMSFWGFLFLKFLRVVIRAQEYQIHPLRLSMDHSPYAVRE
jgi:hypothetical protein